MAALIEWAHKHKIPPAALTELCEMALRLTPMTDDTRSEARVQSELRLVAAKSTPPRYLFRNNIGAGKLATGSFVRFGLANDSQAMNEKFKSGDLIGWEPVRIGPEHVGSVIARFLSVEAKRGDWKFSGTIEEMAQVAWATLVNAQGGRAIITNCIDTLDPPVKQP